MNDLHHNLEARNSKKGKTKITLVFQDKRSLLIPFFFPIWNLSYIIWVTVFGSNPPKERFLDFKHVPDVTLKVRIGALARNNLRRIWKDKGGGWLSVLEVMLMH